MPTTNSDLLYSIALTQLKNVGSITARKLIATLGSVSYIFKASAKELRSVPGVGSFVINEIKNKSNVLEAERILTFCLKHNYDVVSLEMETYPFRLKMLYDAPLVLYINGKNTLNTDRMVGLVGTRKATEYGKKMCEQIAEGSKNSSINFISGLAFGIDAAIHQACQQLEIPNFAVLAGGFHYLYPYQHKKLAESLLENGAWVSEHPPQVKPDARYFPMRNRIIAGLSDAVIVVEAATKGGAIITSEFANNYNREVFAVPGFIDKPYSQGCNRLIYDNKAHLFESMNGFLEHMHWNQNKNKIQKNLSLDFSRFTQNESAILSSLHQLGELSIEELAWKTQIPLKEIALITINLEFNGMIKALAGNRYHLI